MCFNIIKYKFIKSEMICHFFISKNIDYNKLNLEHFIYKILLQHTHTHDPFNSND